MATVGSLLVVLRADTSPFKSKLSNASGFVDKFSGSLANKLIGSAVIIKTLDATFDALTASIEKMGVQGASAFDSMIAGGEALAETLQSIPVAGSLGRLAAVVFDPLFGSPMAEEKDRLRNQAAEDSAHAARQAAGRAETNRLDREGLALTKSLLSPQEQRNSQIAHAKELYAAGTITLDTYNRALAASRPVYEFIESPINVLIGSLQEQAATLGMNARQLDVYRAAQLGAAEAGQAAVNAVHDQIDATQRLIDAQSEASSIFQSTRTPLEQYESTINRLVELLDSGAFDNIGGLDTFSRAARDARSLLENSIGTSGTSGLTAIGGPGGAQSGTFNQFFRTENVVDRTQEQMKNNSKKQLDLSAEQIEQLKRIDQSVRDNQIVIDEVHI